VVPEINALTGIGRGSVPKNLPAIDPYLNTSHDMFQHTAKLIDIRKTCFPLRHGGMYFRAVDKDPGEKGGGFFAYSRVSGPDEMLVLVNSGNNGRPVKKLIVDKNLHGSRQGHKFIDLVSGNATATVSDNGGALDFGNNYFVPANSVAIFYPEGLTKPRAQGGRVCQ
jgi:hypothetical protein